MAGNIKGITIEIDGNTQPLDTALKDVNKTAVKTAGEIKQINKQLKFDPSNTVLLKQKQELLGNQVETNRKKLIALKQAQADVQSEFAKGNIGAEEYRKFEREVEQTKSQLKNYERQLTETSNALKISTGELKSNAASMNDLQSETNNLLQADVMMGFADKIGQAGDKIINFGQDALDAFRAVDAGMDTVTTKTGASGEALAEMQGIVSALAVSIPTDFETAGNAVGELNTQFGYTGQELQSASEILIKYAEINGTDVTTSAISAKQAIEAFGMSNQDLGVVLDTVTKVSQDTGQSVDDIMQKAIAGAPQIKALNLSFQEGAELIGRFEKSGVDSSAALSSLSKATVVYAKEGKTLQEGLNGTVSAIQQASSETEALTIAADVFGSKGASRMVDAIKRGTLSFDDLSTVAQSSAGAVVKTFSETQDPIDTFTMAQNAAVLAMSDIGAMIAETVAPVFRMLATFLQAVSKWFQGLSAPIKQLIVWLGVFVAAIGVIAPIVITIVGAFTAFEGALLGIIATAAPIIAGIAAVIAVLAALVIGIKQLWDTNENFRVAVLAVWQAVSAVISSVVQAVSDFVMSVWGTLTSWWSENQELIRSTADTVWNLISNVIMTVLNTLTPWIQAAWTNIQTIISTVWNVITTVVQTAIAVVQGIITAVMQAINGDWSGAWETIKQVASSVWEGIKSVISNVVKGIASVISNTMGGIVGTVSKIWDGIKNTISKAINGAKDIVSNVIDTIKGLFKFDWSLPKPKLPKITMDGGEAPWGFGGKGKLPSLGIEWFAKGGILTKPTAFGMNGANVMAGGEAGREAVLPLNRQTLGGIGKGIVEAGGLGNSVQNTFNITINTHTNNPQELAREVYREVEKLMIRGIVV